MFSIITIASSTTNPVAIVSAISDRLLIENPARYITPNVPTKDNGTARLGMIVAGTLRRNRKITSTTSATASSNSNCTSATEARIVTVRSVNTVSSTAVGRPDASCGSSVLIRSTVSITLAPGWRCTLTTMPGALLTHAARREFSASFTTSATSRTRIGAPLFQPTIRLR